MGACSAAPAALCLVPRPGLAGGATQTPQVIVSQSPLVWGGGGAPAVNPTRSVDRAAQIGGAGARIPHVPAALAREHPSHLAVWWRRRPLSGKFGEHPLAQLICSNGGRRGGSARGRGACGPPPGAPALLQGLHALMGRLGRPGSGLAAWARHHATACQRWAPDSAARPPGSTPALGAAGSHGGASLGGPAAHGRRRGSAARPAAPRQHLQAPALTACTHAGCRRMWRRTLMMR